MLHPGYLALCEDLRERAERLTHKVMSTAAINEQQLAEQNYLKAQVSVYEDFIGLAKEVKDWKEAHKGN